MAARAAADEQALMLQVSAAWVNRMHFFVAGGEMVARMVVVEQALLLQVGAEYFKWNGRVEACYDDSTT